jgi:hypothetical protein
MTKRRITVTVDADLVAAGANAVQAGQADSVSAWVNHALQRQTEHDHRVVALREAVTAYEAEFGEITCEEMAERERLDAEAAAAVRADGRDRRGAA